MAMKSQLIQPQPFPREGRVRAKQIAGYLSIGLSTWWLYVRQRRVKQPTKFGRNVSVWDAAYVRQLAENGIPEAKTVEGSV